MKNLTLDQWLPKHYPTVHHHWIQAKKEHIRERNKLWYKHNRSSGNPPGRPRKEK